MRPVHSTLVAVLTILLTGPALGQSRYDDDAYADYDAGDANRLHRVSRTTADTPVRVIYARPLTTSRVNTASTRAVDARRALQSGVVIRPPSRAYVVTNPIEQRVQQLTTRAHERRQPAKAERRDTKGDGELTVTIHPAPVSDLSPVGARADEQVQVARFVDTRPDPVTDQIGAVRAQPPIARAHDGIEPANHRRIRTYTPRVTYVTKHTRPVHDLHIPGSGHRQFHTKRVPVYHYNIPRHHVVYFPHYGIGGCGGTGYGFTGYRSHYSRGYTFKFNASYNDGKSSFNLKIGGSR